MSNIHIPTLAVLLSIDTQLVLQMQQTFLPNIFCETISVLDTNFS